MRLSMLRAGLCQRWRFGGAVLLLLSLNACDGNLQEPGIEGQPIIDGALDVDPAHDAVGALIESEDGVSFITCSGTYIGHRTVVTAAHCLPGVSSGQQGLPSFVYFGRDFMQDSNACSQGDLEACKRFIPVVKGRVPKGFFTVDNFMFGDDGTIDVTRAMVAQDIGLLKLATNPRGVTPIPPLPLFGEEGYVGVTGEDKGAGLLLVGFGLANNEGDVDGRRRMGVAVLDEIGPRDAAEMPLSIDQIFSRKRPNTAEPCYGDSGGAVLIQRGGVTFLGGVISMAGVSPEGVGCVDFAVSTRVDVNQEFIRRFQGRGAH